MRSIITSTGGLADRGHRCPAARKS